MDINICGGGDGAVTQPGLDILQTDAVCKQQTGAAMPEVVKPNAAHIMLLQKLGQLLGQIVRPHQFSQFVDIDVVQVIVAVTVAAKLAICQRQNVVL